MTQNVFADIDPATKTGTQLATDLNNFKDSLLSSHLGTSSPTYSVEGTLWMDNTSSNLIAYVEDTGSNDVPIFQIDATNNVARVAMDADEDSYIVADTDDEIDVVLSSSVAYTFKTAGVVAPGIYLGGTAAANNLDYYEEGSWTPSLSSFSGLSGVFSTYTGTYTRVGNLVTLNLIVTGTGMDYSGFSSFIILTGLPFTPAVDGAGTFGTGAGAGLLNATALVRSGSNDLLLTSFVVSGGAHNDSVATVTYRI